MRFAEPSPLPGFELDHEDVVRAGIALRVFRFSEGIADPSRAVVCLHGMSASGVVFARLRPLAAEWDFRLISAPVDGYPGESVGGLARAIEAYLAELDAPVLLGTSWGSLVALQTAIDGGDRLRALVIASGFAYNSKLRGPFAFMRRAMPTLQRWAPRVVGTSVRVVGGRTLDADGRRELVRQSREVTSAERSRRLRAVFTTDLRGGLGTIRVPSLVIHGTSDRLVPLRDARALARGIPGCGYAEIEGEGHVPYVTSPERFTSILGEFLAGV